MKRDRTISTVLFLLLSLFAVYGTPMGPNEQPSEQPRFGEVLNEHLIAPDPQHFYEAHQDHRWNYAPQYSYGDAQHSPLHGGFPAVPSSLDPQGHHFYGAQPNYGAQAPPTLIWNQAIPIQQTLHNNELPNNHFTQDMQGGNIYNTNFIDDDASQSVQTDYPYVANHHDHMFLQGMERGQGSGSSSLHQSYPGGASTQAAGLTHNPAGFVINLNRPYRPQAELDARPEKLSCWDWQKKYTQHELMIIYGNIAHKWGAQSRTTLCRNLFDRLNREFSTEAIKIELVLAGHPGIIKEVATDTGLRYLKVSSKSESDTMTPEAFLDWILKAPVVRSQSSRGGFIRPHWASNWIKNAEQVSKILQHLQTYWNLNEQRVNEILQNVTEAEMDPYLAPLLGRTKKAAEQAADYLYNDIQLKEQQHRSAASQGFYQQNQSGQYHQYNPQGGY